MNTDDIGEEYYLDTKDTEFIEGLEEQESYVERVRMTTQMILF